MSHEPAPMTTEEELTFRQELARLEDNPSGHVLDDVERTLEKFVAYPWRPASLTPYGLPTRI